MKIAISDKRADKIKDKLKKKGMDPARIEQLMQKHYVQGANPADFGEWAHFKLSYELDGEEQENYEFFSSGWLSFYDIITRSASIQHEILFNWNVKGSGNSDEVQVMLNPPPAEPLKLFKNVKLFDEQGLVTYGFTKDPPSPTPPPPPL